MSFKKDKDYDVAIQMCETIINMNSQNDVVKNKDNEFKSTVEKNDIFIYQAVLINNLKSYDVNDVESDKVVYELSDKGFDILRLILVI